MQTLVNKTRDTQFYCLPIVNFYYVSSIVGTSHKLSPVFFFRKGTNNNFFIFKES